MSRISGVNNLGSRALELAKLFSNEWNNLWGPRDKQSTHTGVTPDTQKKLPAQAGINPFLGTEWFRRTFLNESFTGAKDASSDGSVQAPEQQKRSSNRKTLVPVGGSATRRVSASRLNTNNNTAGLEQLGGTQHLGNTIQDGGNAVPRIPANEESRIQTYRTIPQRMVNVAETDRSTSKHDSGTPLATGGGSGVYDASQSINQRNRVLLWIARAMKEAPVLRLPG